MAIIEARGLARTFTSRKAAVEAVRGVDLTVSEGEIVGFLGPNGAGKTTTLRMLTTLLRPTAGTATVAGADLLADPVEVRRRIGYVAQAPQGEIAERTSRLTRQLDLGGLDDRQVKTLSGGQRRRLDISLGLVHSPRLVFLDEPTTGLDPQSRSNLWDHIRRLREDLGTTIFLTTHYLDEADALCDRILVIDYGKIVAEGSPDELKRQISGEVITLSVSGGPDAAKGVLGTHDGVRDVTVSGQSLRLTVDHGEEALPGMLRELDAAGLALQSIQLARPTLDDVFLTVTGRSLREDAPGAAPPDRVPVA
jgi:ABC-2 type transport system ATP-binding protein